MPTKLKKDTETRKAAKRDLFPNARWRYKTDAELRAEGFNPDGTKLSNSATDNGPPKESEVSEETETPTKRARRRGLGRKKKGSNAEKPTELSVKKVDEDAEVEPKRFGPSTLKGGNTGPGSTKPVARGSGSFPGSDNKLGPLRVRGGQTGPERNTLKTTELGKQQLLDFSLTTESIFPGEDELIEDARVEAIIEKKFRSLGKTKFESNILSQYENVTYNIRLFMAHEAAEHETISREEIVIVAETGSTGMNITELTFDSTIAPAGDTKNTIAEQFTFTIIEPHGNRLFDQIRNASVDLGIKDPRSAPMWISITFKGYSPGENDFFNSSDGGIASKALGQNDDLNNINFLWKIIINEAKAEIDKGGTVYTFRATPQNHIAFRDDARRLEKDETINARTVGDYFSQLFIRLNQYNNYSLNDPSSSDVSKRVREYGLIFPDEFPDMEDWVINAPQDDKCENVRSSQPMASTTKKAKRTGRRGFSAKKEAEQASIAKATAEAEAAPQQSGIKGIRDNGDGVKSIKFSVGTPIESIVQEILSATEEGQQLAIFGEKKGTATRAGNENEFREANKPAIIFMVEPLTTITSYNDISKLYNYFITYHIKPYFTHKPLLTRKQIKVYQGIDSKKRLDNSLKISKLKKRYDYVFTGLNTEVLDYNIVFNNAWFLPLPIFRGQNKDGVATSSRKLVTEKVSAQISQEKSPSEDTTKTEKALEKKRVTDKFNDIEKLTKDELNKKSITQLQEQQEAIAEAAKIGINTGGRMGGAVKRNEAALDRRFKSNVKKRETSLEDINTTSLGANQQLFRLENDFVSPFDITNTIENKSLVELFRSGDRKTISLKEFRELSSTNISSTPTNQTKTGSIFFVEDFERKSVASRVATDTTEETQIDTKTISTELSPTLSNFQGNIPGTISRGRSYFTAVMNQMYGAFGDLVDLDLTIKGDPYWMGETDPVKRVFSSEPLKDSKDLTRADTLILLTFDFPNKFGDGGNILNINSSAGTGLVDLERGDNAFNGIYLISNIKHEFSNGKFTQKLRGVIDAVTKQQDLLTLFTQDQI